MIKCLLQREQIQANKEVCGYDCFWIWIKLLRYRNMFFLRAFLHTILIWNTVGVDGSVKSEWLFFLFWSHSKISSTVNNCEGYSVRDLILSHDTENYSKNHYNDAKYILRCRNNLPRRNLKPAIYANSSRKWNFSRTLFKPKEFENAGSLRDGNLFENEAFRNAWDHDNNRWFPCQRFSKWPVIVAFYLKSGLWLSVDGKQIIIMCFQGNISVFKFFRCSADEALLDKWLSTQVSKEVLVQRQREMEG